MTDIAHSSFSPTLSDEQLQRLADIVLFKQRNIINYFADHGTGKVSITQFIMLDRLAAHGPMNMGQLAQLMQHTTPATTGVVDRLIKARLVERVANPDDRRQIIIKLTDKGGKIVSVLRQRLVAFLNNVSTQLSPEDQQSWYRVNDRIFDSINQ